MEAHIQCKPATMGYEVWLFDRRMGETTIYNMDGSFRETLPQGIVDIKPSGLIDDAALKAFVAAASDHLPPSSATERHLADATAVRDRLLTLVEQQAGRSR